MARTYEKKAFTPECVPETLKGTAFMEEAGADTFEISNLPFVPSGVLAHVLRSDDVAIAVDGTYTNGKAVVTLDADCYHVAGRLSVAIYITDASMNSQCVYACVGNVYRTVGDTELDSGTEVPTLAQLEAAYQACISATQQATNAVSYVEQTGKTDAQKAQARTNIGAISDSDLDDLRMTDLQLGGMISDVGHSLAAEYDWQAGTYAVGDYVMSGDKLYRCTTAIATPETWTPAHWTEVKLTGEVTDLKGAITENKTATNVSYVEELTYSTGYKAKTGQVYTGGSYDNYRYCDTIEVSPGDIVRTYKKAVVGYPKRTNLNPAIVILYSGESVVDYTSIGSNPYTIPAGVDGICFTITSGNAASFAVEIKRETESTIIKTDSTLTDTNTPANAKAVGDIVFPIDNDLYEKSEQTVHHDDNIPYSELTYEPNYIAANGTAGAPSEYSHIEISVKSGNVVTYKGSGGTSKTMTFICALEDGIPNSSKGSSSAVTSFTVPSGVNGIVISLLNTNIADTDYVSIAYDAVEQVATFSVPESVRDFLTATPSDIGKMPKVKTVADGKVTEWEFDDASVELDDTLTQEGEAADAKAVGDAIGALSDITTVTEEVTQKTQVEPVYSTGFMGANGQVYTGGSYDGFRYTNKITVQPGDKVYIYTQSGWTTESPRVLTAFNGDTAVTASGGNTPAIPYTVPNDINGIVITLAQNAATNDTIYIQREVMQTVPALQEDVDELKNHTPEVGPNGLVMSFDLSSGATYTDPDSRSLDDKYGYAVSFFGHISSLTGELWIIKGPSDYGKTIIIDGTYIKYCNSSDTSTSLLTTEHGLTIADYISITIDCGYGEQSVRVRTNGGEYLWEIGSYDPCNGALAVKSTSDAISDCVLSYNCYAAKTDNWLYGDSYFSGWPKRLVRYGNHNHLCNGHGGRGSIKALASFNLDLSFGQIPKRVIWCMGMNDKDGASAPNQAWMYAVSEIMRICEEKGIELILATIPNVPSSDTKNTEKNAYIRESGYRYIDFAKAVSPNDDTTWYDGMLSQDNVHPTDEGSQALYSIAVATVPELLD